DAPEQRRRIAPERADVPDERRPGERGDGPGHARGLYQRHGPSVRSPVRPSLIAGAHAGLRAKETPRPAGDRILGDEFAARPALLARKQRRLDGIADVRAVEPVAVDLARERLDEALARTGFDRGAAACFLVEGVLHYLGSDGVDRLLAAIACATPRPRVLASF